MTDNIRALKERLNAIRSMSMEEPVVEVKPYKTPSMQLLKSYCPWDQLPIKNNLDPQVLTSKLKEFGLNGTVARVTRGPRITRYEIKLAPGVKISQVRNLSEDLAIALMSDKVRIQAPIPGTSLVGIEILNEIPAIIGLKDLIKDSRKADCELPIAIGTDVTGKPRILDLSKMPHLLIAGQTGSGKSVCLNSIILSVLYNKTPEECELMLVDPKRVEMTSYFSVPHLRHAIVTDPDEALSMFQGLVREMERRYRLLEEASVRNIVSYNQMGNKMPYIVVIVDEMSDLMMTSGKELEKCIVRLAQLARAVGIHLVLATQKPVVKVITGLIKSNMPSRISFQVASKTDSRVILDQNGAEKLAGRGDMLATHPEVTEPERLHGAWVSDEEIKNITDSFK